MYVLLYSTSMPNAYFYSFFLNLKHFFLKIKDFYSKQSISIFI